MSTHKISLFLCSLLFALSVVASGVEKGDNSGYEEFFSALFALLLVWAFVRIIIGLFAKVASMARQRGRSPFFWVLVGMASNPFTAMFILWLIGASED